MLLYVLSYNIHLHILYYLLIFHLPYSIMLAYFSNMMLLILYLHELFHLYIMLDIAFDDLVMLSHNIHYPLHMQGSFQLLMDNNILVHITDISHYHSSSNITDYIFSIYNGMISLYMSLHLQL